MCHLPGCLLNILDNTNTLICIKRCLHNIKYKEILLKKYFMNIGYLYIDLYGKLLISIYFKIQTQIVSILHFGESYKIF